MKNNSSTYFTISASIALTLILVLVLAVWLPAQAQSDEPVTVNKDAKMMEGCQAMKAQKVKIMEDMKAQDAELTEHVAKMNSAPPDKKTDIIADVVTQMVEQRIAIDARKAKMQEEMMEHMMEHMQMGSESMTRCPMMKEMDEKAADTRESHQQ